MNRKRLEENMRAERHPDYNRPLTGEIALLTTPVDHAIRHQPIRPDFVRQYVR